MVTESRLSKRTLYDKYKSLVQSSDSHGYYSDAKAKVKDYTQVKDALYKHFTDLGYGNWLRKPQEQNMFK